MINGTVKGLNNVRHVPKFGRNLILLTWLDFLGYGYSARRGIMQVTKCALVEMKGEKAFKNLYKLIGETNKGGV